MPLTAYRVWKMASSAAGEPLLGSLVRRTWWPAKRPLRARPCHSCENIGPPELDDYGDFRPAGPLFGVRNCSCGIHAVTDPAFLLGMLEDLVYGNTVLGTVELWGRVMPHAGSYRAEYGRVRSLFYFRSVTKAAVAAEAAAAGDGGRTAYLRVGRGGYPWEIRCRAEHYGVPLLPLEEEAWSGSWLKALATL